MEFKGIKLNIVILVAIIVIIAFFASKHLLNIYNIEQPLVNDLLAIDGIKDIKLVDENNKTDIFITLEPEVNFFKLYKKVDKISSSQLGKNRGDININNNSNPTLDKLYHKLHFSIYEGIATNQFTTMKKQIDKIVNQYKLTNYKLWIDNDNIYLKLVENENAFYQIIPRRDKYVLNNLQGGEQSG